MQKNIFSGLGIVFTVAVALCSCSSDKVLPQGKRISVLANETIIKPEVANNTSQIKIAKTEPVNEWLQYDYNDTHILPNIKIGSEFKKQWKSDFGTGSSKREFLLSRPLVKDNKVYTLDAEGVLSAFKLSNGENIWKIRLESANSKIDSSAIKGAGLAIDNNTIFATTGFGVVVAINAKDGSKIWEKNLKSALRIAPLATNGKVFVQSVDNEVYALDAQSGEILWNAGIALENTKMVGGAVPAYNKSLDTILIGFSSGEIQAFNASIGTPLWSDIMVSNHQAYSSTFLHTIKASPVIEGETAYIIGSSDVFAAIDMRSGTRLWEKEIGSVNTPLLSGNTLFIVSNDNELIALDKNNGKVIWATPIEIFDKPANVVVYAPIISDNKLLVAMSDGHVALYDPYSGKRVSVTDIDEEINSSPIAVKGYIIFTTANAKIIAYK